MDSQERIIRSLEGKFQETIPIFIPGVDNKFLSEFNKKYERNAEENNCTCNGVDLMPLAYLGVDCTLVSGPPHFRSEIVIPDLDLDNAYLDEFGRIIRKEFIQGVEYHVYQGPYLINDERISEWEFMKPRKIPQGWPKKTYKEILNAVENHDICPIFTIKDGLYKSLEEGIGLRNTAYFFHDFPEFLDLHLDKIYSVLINDVNVLLDAGAAFIMIEDAITMQNRPTITPDLVDAYLLKYYKKITTRIHERGGKAFFKSIGDISSVIESICNANFDAVHVTYHGPDYLEKISKICGEDICLMGNFDTTFFMRDIASLKIRKEVQETLLVGEESYKYIFGTNGPITNTTNLSNIKEMIQTVKNFRRAR
ncbi:MAG: uroporphyrinogen decarboxylase family protein [Promethearchaeota archaeon]